jgi:acyl-CoA synthetase (AMP-forming)/AMP-acid ligase II
MPEQGNLTLRGMLLRAARWHRGQEAVVDASLRYTYVELLDNASRCATALSALGVRKGDRVVFLTLSSSLHTVGWYACQLIGALPVCLHIRETPPLLAKTKLPLYLPRRCRAFVPVP